MVTRNLRAKAIDQARQAVEMVSEDALRTIRWLQLERNDQADRIKALEAALKDCIEVIEKNTYPTPDKPHTDWSRGRAAREVLENVQAARE